MSKLNSSDSISGPSTISKPKRLKDSLWNLSYDLLDEGNPYL
jgi:hypothetical protein